MNLETLFKPKNAIAVVGVSTTNWLNPGTVVWRKNYFMQGAKRNVYGVNPKGGIIDGQPIFQSIEDVPEKLDLVVGALRAEHTPELVEQAGRLGVPAMIVVSGGFAEVGGKGRELEDEMAKLAYKYDIALIGPNCVGIIAPPYVDTFFIPSERFTRPKFGGNIMVVSQSGGVLADQFFAKFAQREIAIAGAVSIGNKAVIDEITLLEYFARDPQIKNMVFYLEGFGEGEGRDFLLSAAKTNKTIMVYKGGRSDAGARAAASHTAAVATSGAIGSSAFKQYSILEIRSEQELVSFTKTFTELSEAGRPFYMSAIHGDVVVLTVSGGHGVLATDLLHEYALNLVSFTPEEVALLRTKINPSAASIASYHNPIDLTGSVMDDDIVYTLDTLLQMPKVEIVLLLILPYPPFISMALGERVRLVARMHKKPVVAYVPRLERYRMIFEALEDGNIPTADTIEQAVQMAYAIHQRSRAIARFDARNKESDLTSLTDLDYSIEKDRIKTPGIKSINLQGSEEGVKSKKGSKKAKQPL
ncbi:MAG: acetyl-CoA synthetase [Promethearchaeota archaeon CR_4]|nr:MAG: acetyl-CoA synthetase [Candidatus Lokiarchaeota archaeon CR_4]